MKMQKKFIISLAGLLIFSLALGAVWTTKRVTNNAGTSTYPAIAVSGSSVYLVWSDLTPGDQEIFFRKSIDGGVTWQGSKRLSYSDDLSSYPDIAVSGSDVYVVWSDYTPGNYDIYFRKSADGGATWEKTQRLTANAGDSWYPKIAVIGAKICVVWSDYTPGNAEIYFRKSIDGGATWQKAKRLTNNAGTSYNPDIAGKGANVYVVWDDVSSGNDDMYFMRSGDGGANWQAAKRLTNNSGASEFSALAAGGALGSNICVAWQDDTPGNDEIYFRKSADGGSTWQASRRLTNNAGISATGAIAINDSSVYVVYYDNTPGNWEIYVVKSLDGGATWGTARRLTDNSGSSTMPVVALSVANAYVAYDDNTPGNYEIYLKYSPL